MKARCVHRAVWPPHLDVIADAQGFEPGRTFAHHGLLDVDHTAVARQPRQEVLGPLVDEMPAQMREDDQGIHVPVLLGVRDEPVSLACQRPRVLA